MNEPQRKPSPVALIGTAAAVAVGIAITRGLNQEMPLNEILKWAFVGLVFAAVYFSAIYWLLKGFDRIRAKRRRARSP